MIELQLIDFSFVSRGRQMPLRVYGVEGNVAVHKWLTHVAYDSINALGLQHDICEIYRPSIYSQSVRSRRLLC